MGVNWKFFTGSLLASFLVFGVIFNLPKIIQAAQTINSATLNGMSSVTVSVNTSVSASITATLTASGTDDWVSTGWRINSGPETCVDTADYTTGGPFTEGFSITSPSSAGTYNVTLTIYANASCGNPSESTTLIGGIVVPGATPTPSPTATPNGNPGAIWTTDATCGDSQQDANQFDQGDHVFINGSNFNGNTQYAWSITGQPGNASGDPNQVVVSGNQTTDSNGAFCFDAYTVAIDDCGEYNVDFENKGDNYHISISCAQASPTPTPTPGPGTPSPTPFCDNEEFPCPTPTPAPTVLGDNDVCTNIDGVQTSVPNGLHLDASGRNCVDYQLSGPPTENGSGQVLGASTSGKVLGASTTAKTGTAEDMVGLALVLSGTILVGTSFNAYRKVYAQ